MMKANELLEIFKEIKENGNVCKSWEDVGKKLGCDYKVVGSHIGYLIFKNSDNVYVAVFEGHL